MAYTQTLYESFKSAPQVVSNISHVRYFDNFGKHCVFWYISLLCKGSSKKDNILYIHILLPSVGNLYEEFVIIWLFSGLRLFVNF